MRASFSSPRFLGAPSADRRRGSVLIVALVLCAIIGVSLGSYIALSGSSLKLANRSFFNTSAINLAETGVEEALYCFNQATAGVGTAIAWAGWTVSGANAKRTFTDFTLSGGATVAVRVLVINYNPAGSIQPKVYSEATVTIPNESRTITKVLEVDLRRRSRFAMGLVAKNQITFNGNVAKVDSWNSEYNDDGTARASPVAYDVAYRHASGSVGSTSVGVGSVAINNADIYGFASVGTSNTTGLRVGTNGIISGNFSASGGTIDSTRIATDFTANFDAMTNPNGAVDLTTWDTTLGGTGVTATYRYSGAITGSFSVTGNITLILTGSGDVMKLNGAGDTLTINSGSSLIIYTAGDIDLTGGGVANPNSQASTLQIYGTGTSTQRIDIGGGAEFTGVVYAPEASVRVFGTPEVMGSIVANNITVMGNAKFHYDEALANWGGNNPFGIVKWLELTAPTDRATAFAAW